MHSAYSTVIAPLLLPGAENPLRYAGYEKNMDRTRKIMAGQCLLAIEVSFPAHYGTFLFDNEGREESYRI